MKPTLADLKKLQFSLLASLLMLAAGSAAVHFSLASAHAARLALGKVQMERNDAEEKLRRVSSEQREIREKSAQFSRLQEQGIVGEERRLEWVELIHAIRAERQLIDLQYEIEPQRLLESIPGTRFAFYASTMQLQFGALHEEDLLRLVDDLRQRAHALIQIRSCSLSRRPAQSASRDNQAQLQAECLIDWVTLHENPPA